MTDIRSRLAQVDTKAPPDDLWMRATDLAARDTASFELPSARTRRSPHDPATGWRKVGVIVAAFAIFGAAVGFAWIILTRGDDPKPPQPVEDPFGQLPGGWTELRPPPEIRCCAATAWTGSELLIWGGHVGQTDESQATGFVYDAQADTWTAMPPSPLGPRSLPAGVWTGSEFLVWGGADFTTRYPYEQYADGAAYDPVAETWRMLPAAPIDAREPLVVWTGEEMIVWGNQDRENRKVDGAAYDPASNTWRRIADAPIELTDAAASWTGQEMIVFGAALHGGNHAETPTAIGAAYDPATDSWRTLADSSIDTNANDSLWIGDRLLAWDYGLATQTYDPTRDRWTDAGSAPTDRCEDVPSTVFAEAAFGRLCGDLVRFDATDSTWSLVDDPSKEFFPTELFGAGDVFLVAGVEDRFGEGEDWRFYAYRTPAVPEQDPEQVPLASSGASTTYRLSDFELRYPFRANPSGTAGAGSSAGVKYTATWVTPHYPGSGDCTIVLTNGAGEEVGRKEFEFGGAEPVSTIPDWESIPVDSRPVSASGWCGGDPEASANFGQGYVFTQPRVVDSTQIDGVEISFDVSWIGASPPGMRTCTLTVALSDGSTRAVRGGIDIGQEHDETTYLMEGVRSSEVLSSSVSCHPPGAS